MTQSNTTQFISGSTRSRAEEVRERRTAILDQAITIIGQRGYHGFGLQELAERCGLSKTGLLHHFKSKDQLLVAVLREREARDGIAIAEALARREGGTPPRFSVISILASFREIILRNMGQPELVRLQLTLRVEALNPDHPAHEYFQTRERAKLELWAEVFEQHVADPQALARQLTALLCGLEEQWLRDDSDMLADWDAAISSLLGNLSVEVSS